MSDVGSALRDWESFYVIIGSSAGALTGLQFVVLTLVAQAEVSQGNRDATAAFGSPTVVHFCAALVVAALISVPWRTMGPPSFAILIGGAVGILYSILVLRRAFRQKGYRPVLEDWIWHIVLPLSAYSTIFTGGVLLRPKPEAALLAIGAAALLLVLIGIHNAWDSVTYITHEMLPRLRQRAPGTEAGARAGSPRPAAGAAPPKTDAED